MDKMNRLAIMARTRAFMAKESIKEALANKKFGDSQVVVALILIVVAVGLAIIFRNQINTIISNVSARVNNAISDLGNGNVAASKGNLN